MSIEFSANLRKEVNDDTLYEFGHERVYEDIDGSIGRILSDKYDNDMAYYFYQYVQKNGYQPLSFWISEYKQFGDLVMDEGGAFPEFSIVKNGKVVMSLSCIAYLPSDSRTVQMSNMNANTIFQLLELDSSDGMGSVSPLALLRKIESVKGSRMLQEFTRPDSDSPRTYGGGIDVNYLEGKLLQLESLADFCVQNECNITWS